MALVLFTSCNGGGGSSSPPAIANAIVSTIPAQDAGQVSVDTLIQVRFTKPLIASTVNETSFVVTRSGALVPGSVNYDPVLNIATMDPAGPLQHSSLYTVTLTSTMKTQSGLSIVPWGWSFTTEDLIPPVILDASPQPNETQVPADTNLTAKFSKEMVLSSLVNGGFTLHANGNPIDGVISYDSTTNTASFDPVVSSLPSQAVCMAQLHSSIIDIDGIPIEPMSWTFEIEDNQPPMIAGKTPIENATDVYVGSTVQVAFSEPMNPATLTDATFYLVESSNPSAHLGQIVLNPVATQALIQSAQEDTPLFQYGKTYTVTLVSGPSGALDLEGLPMEGPNVVWSFTVEEESLPTIVAMNPEEGGLPLSNAGNIVITFSEAMNPESVNTTTFSLVKEIDQSSIPGVVSEMLDGTHTTFVFDPYGNGPQDLEMGTLYRVTVLGGPDGVKDASPGGGSRMENSVVWTFFTAGPTSEVTTTFPIAGDQEVPCVFVYDDGDVVALDYPMLIAVTFSQPLNPNTVNANTFLVKDQAGTALTGAVSYLADQKKAVFQPSNEFSGLAVNTQYNVTLTGIKDAFGSPIQGSNGVGTDYLFSFQTITYGIGAYDMIQNTNVEGALPQISYNANAQTNKIQILFQQKKPGGSPENGIYYNAFDLYPNKAAEQAVSQGSGNAIKPQFAIHPITGMSYAVWQQKINGESVYSILFSRKALNGNWEAPIPLDTLAEQTGTNAENPQIVVDSTDNISVVWQQAPNSNPTRTSIYLAQALNQDQGATWNAPIPIEVPVNMPGLFGGSMSELQSTAGPASQPQIGFANGNNIVVLFLQRNLMMMTTQGWTEDKSASLVSTESTGLNGLGGNFVSLDLYTSNSSAYDVANHTLARDSAGNVVVAYQQYETFSAQTGNQYSVRCAARSASNGWILLAPGSGYAAVSTVALGTTLLSQAEPSVAATHVDQNFIVAYTTKSKVLGSSIVPPPYYRSGYAQKVNLNGNDGLPIEIDCGQGNNNNDVQQPRVFVAPDGTIYVAFIQGTSISGPGSNLDLFIAKHSPEFDWSSWNIPSPNDSLSGLLFGSTTSHARFAMIPGAAFGPSVFAVFEQTLGESPSKRIMTNSYR